MELAPAKNSLEPCAVHQRRKRANPFLLLLQQRISASFVAVLTFACADGDALRR